MNVSLLSNYSPSIFVLHQGAKGVLFLFRLSLCIFRLVEGSNHSTYPAFSQVIQACQYFYIYCDIFL